MRIAIDVITQISQCTSHLLFSVQCGTSMIQVSHACKQIFMYCIKHDEVTRSQINQRK